MGEMRCRVMAAWMLLRCGTQYSLRSFLPRSLVIARPAILFSARNAKLPMRVGPLRLFCESVVFNFLLLPLLLVSRSERTASGSLPVVELHAS